MKRLLLVLALLVAPLAHAYDITDRAQIPERINDPRTGVRYASTLIPRSALFSPRARPLFAMPLTDIRFGKFGSGSVTSGSSPIVGGADTRVCFNDGGFMNCGDAGLTFNKTTDALTTVILNVTSINRWLSPVDTGFVFGTSDATTNNAIQFRSALTPNSVALMTGSTSESWHIYQYADAAANFGNGRGLAAANTNPSLIIHSPDQVTTEYLQFNADATGAGHVQSNLAELTVGGFKNNITEGSAQAIVRITMPSAGIFGAWVSYTVSDSDGTDHVGRNGSIQIQGANKAGTSVCTIAAARDTEAEDGSAIVNAAGAFTLTYTWTNVVNTTSCDLSLNGASSAGANTFDIVYTVVLNGSSNAIVVTPIP